MLQYFRYFLDGWRANQHGWFLCNWIELHYIFLSLLCHKNLCRNELFISSWSDEINHFITIMYIPDHPNRGRIQDFISQKVDPKKPMSNFSQNLRYINDCSWRYLWSIWAYNSHISLRISCTLRKNYFLLMFQKRHFWWYKYVWPLFFQPFFRAIWIFQVRWLGVNHQKFISESPVQNFGKSRRSRELLIIEGPDQFHWIQCKILFNLLF